MAVRMRVLAVTGMGELGQPCWLAGFDVEAHDGMGEAWYTEYPQAALTWPDTASAMAAWRSVPEARPVRDDGRPNRPLAALTVELEAAP